MDTHTSLQPLKWIGKVSPEISILHGQFLFIVYFIFFKYIKEDFKTQTSNFYYYKIKHSKYLFASFLISGIKEFWNLASCRLDTKKRICDILNKKNKDYWCSGWLGLEEEEWKGNSPIL